MINTHINTLNISLRQKYYLNHIIKMLREYLNDTPKQDIRSLLVITNFKRQKITPSQDKQELITPTPSLTSTCLDLCQVRLHSILLTTSSCLLTLIKVSSSFQFLSSSFELESQISRIQSLHLQYITYPHQQAITCLQKLVRDPSLNPTHKLIGQPPILRYCLQLIPFINHFSSF